MGCRNFITFLGSTMVMWSLIVAQQAERTRCIGVLMGECRERPGRTGVSRRVPGGTPEAWVGREPQHTDRHSLVDPRRFGAKTLMT